MLQTENGVCVCGKTDFLLWNITRPQKEKHDSFNTSSWNQTLLEPVYADIYCQVETGEKDRRKNECYNHLI